MRGTRSWLILCTLGPLVAALPSPRERLHSENDLSIVSKTTVQHELVAYLVQYLRKHAISAILRLEIFTIASGNHFTIPPSDTKLDEDLHRGAQALTRLWTRLATMERMDTIINNATVEVASHTTEDFPDQKIVQALLKNIEQRLKDEPSMYHDYWTFKNTTSASVLHSCKLFFKVEEFNDDQHEEVFMNWVAQATMKKYFVNKLFLQQSVRGKDTQELNYFRIAKSLMRLAQNENWTSIVQQIYDETIDEVAKDFSVMDHPYESNSRIFKNYGYELRVDRTTLKLFDRLIEKCQTFPELNDHLRMIEEKFSNEKNLDDQKNKRVINLFPL